MALELISPKSNDMYILGRVVRVEYKETLAEFINMQTYAYF